MTYELLDSGDFQKLEKVGPFRLVRPAPQAVWRVQHPELWQEVSARFDRDQKGRGTWQVMDQRIHEPFAIELGGVRLLVRLTDFGHLGVFPEHLETLGPSISTWCAENPGMRVLNLFGYTGAHSLLCLQAGAQVTHVDASRASVLWAKENAKLSGLEAAPIRWMVEDVRKFLGREIRRGQRYDGVILDPPSYGRGPKGQVWKIEEDLGGLLGDVYELLSQSPRFVVLTTHTNAYTPLALKNLMSSFKGRKESGEMITGQHLSTPLPSGSYCTVAFP